MARVEHHCRLLKYLRRRHGCRGGGGAVGPSDVEVQVHPDGDGVVAVAEVAGTCASSNRMPALPFAA